MLFSFMNDTSEVKAAANAKGNLVWIVEFNNHLHNNNSYIDAVAWQN